jgi:hypothetical protein
MSVVRVQMRLALAALLHACDDSAAFKKVRRRLHARSVARAAQNPRSREYSAHATLDPCTPGINASLPRRYSVGWVINQRRAASAVHGSAFERLSPRQALPRIATLCGFADVSASYAHTVCLWSTARLLRVHTWYL